MEFAASSRKQIRRECLFSASYQGTVRDSPLYRTFAGNGACRRANRTDEDALGEIACSINAALPFKDCLAGPYGAKGRQTDQCL
jgi:hypothetical protein